MRNDSRRTDQPCRGLLALLGLLVFVWSAPVLADCGVNEGGDPAKGAKIYNETCIACHGADGRGTVPGAPDFNKKGAVESRPHEVMTRHIKNGFREPGKPLAMPPKGGNPDLNDDDVLDVQAFLHKRFFCR
jgi:cytochrome c5